MRVTSGAKSTGLGLLPVLRKQSPPEEPDRLRQEVRGAISLAQERIATLSGQVDGLQQEIANANDSGESSEVLVGLIAACSTLMKQHEDCESWLARAVGQRDELERLCAQSGAPASPPGEMRRWSREWHGLLEAFDAISVTSPSNLPAADPESPAAEPELPGDPFPGDPQEQLKRLADMRREIDGLEERKAGMKADLDRVLDQYKQAARDGSHELAPLKEEYAAHLQDWQDCKALLEARHARFIDSIRDNLEAISVDTLLELSVEPVVTITAAVTEEEAVRACSRHIEDVKKLYSELTAGHHAPLEPELQNKIESWRIAAIGTARDILTIQKAAIDAEARISELKEAFPPHLRRPTRFQPARISQQDADMEALVPVVVNCRQMYVTEQRLLDEAKARGEAVQTGPDSDLQLFRRTYRQRAETYVEFDELSRNLAAIRKNRDRGQLDRVAERLCNLFRLKNGLHRCPEVYLELFGEVAAIYNEWALREGEEKQGTKPKRPATAKKDRQPPPRSPEKPPAQARPRQAAEKKTAGRAVRETNDPPTFVEAEIPHEGEWRVSRAPPAPWSMYTPFGELRTVALRDTSWATQNRASILMNWDGRTPTGADHVLTARESLALVDWITCACGPDRDDNDRLFEYQPMIHCDKGTGSFEGRYQLKIVNLDPDVPDFIAPAGPKRPTFHFFVNDEDVAGIKAALAARGFNV